MNSLIILCLIRLFLIKCLAELKCECFCPGFITFYGHLFNTVHYLVTTEGWQNKSESIYVFSFLLLPLCIHLFQGVRACVCVCVRMRAHVHRFCMCGDTCGGKKTSLVVVPQLLSI